MSGSSKRQKLDASALLSHDSEHQPPSPPITSGVLGSDSSDMEVSQVETVIEVPRESSADETEKNAADTPSSVADTSSATSVADSALGAADTPSSVADTPSSVADAPSCVADAPSSVADGPSRVSQLLMTLEGVESSLVPSATLNMSQREKDDLLQQVQRQVSTGEQGG